MSKTLYVRVPDEVHASVIKIAKANDGLVNRVAGELIEIGVEQLLENGEVTVKRRRLRAPAARR